MKKISFVLAMMVLVTACTPSNAETFYKTNQLTRDAPDEADVVATSLAREKTIVAPATVKPPTQLPDPTKPANMPPSPTRGQDPPTATIRPTDVPCRDMEGFEIPIIPRAPNACLNSSGNGQNLRTSRGLASYAYVEYKLSLPDACTENEMWDAVYDALYFYDAILGDYGWDVENRENCAVRAGRPEERSKGVFCWYYPPKPEFNFPPEVVEATIDFNFRMSPPEYIVKISAVGEFLNTWWYEQGLIR